MFGFLRRKKPGEPVTPVPDDRSTTPGDASATPGDASPAVSAVGSNGATPTPTLATTVPVTDVPAGTSSAPGGASRGGFWSRFIPGGRTPSAPADSGPEDGTTVDPAEAAAIEAEVAAAAAAAAQADAEAAALDAQRAREAAAAEQASSLPTSAPSAPPSAEPATTLEPVPAPQPDRTPWLARLKQGLSRTSGNLAALFVGVKVDEALFEELESALLTSDTGVETTTWLLAALRERVKQDRITDAQQVKTALRALLVELLTPLEGPIDIDRAEPLVVMIAGVNGAGKTTSIGKLARHLRREGKSVLLAAGDTFRAAAREQLAQWGSRNEVDVISQQGGDPAAVAFDAVAAGIARRTGVVMVDTAGRLPTQTHLMDELRKIRRVITKAMPDAPHEVLLVLDGNTGQNMLSQVKAFDDTVQLSGLVVTKLDGTAKGGALAALAHTRRDRPIPVYFIGVGEGIEDLQAFSAEEFAAALIG